MLPQWKTASVPQRLPGHPVSRNTHRPGARVHSAKPAIAPACDGGKSHKVSLDRCVHGSAFRLRWARNGESQRWEPPWNDGECAATDGEPGHAADAVDALDAGLARRCSGCAGMSRAMRPPPVTTPAADGRACGEGVVTGGKSGIQASRGKEIAKYAASDALVTCLLWCAPFEAA